MDNRTIFTKTAKGLGEAVGKTRALSRHLRNILKEIDGNTTLGELQNKLGKLSEAELHEVLSKLSAGEYIREYVPLSHGGHDDDFGLTITDTSEEAGEPLTESVEFLEEVMRLDREARKREKLERSGKAQAEAQAKAQPIKEAEERARREAEQQARRDAEEKARRETEEKLKKEAAEKIRREVEERVRKSAEKAARQKAEEQARRQLEEDARRKAETQAKKEAEERTRREAEQKVRQEAEEKTRREAEERAKKEAAEKARRQVEAQAKKEAEERARQEAEQQARQEAEEQIKRDAEAKLKKEAAERAQREAKERGRKEAEERARREAEEKARCEAEKKLKEAAEKERYEAEERARKEAEKVARQKAEEQARRQLEEDARRKAEAQAKKEAEERTRREAEQKSRQEAEEKVRREVEEKRNKEEAERTQREAEERAKKELDERARRESDQQARRKAEEKARREAEEQAKKEAADRTRREAVERAERDAAATMSVKKPVEWGKYVAQGLFSLILLGLGLMHVISFDGQALLFEKSATEQFQQPVKINKVYLSLLPQPHWRLENVSIGKEGQIRAPQVNAIVELSSLFSDKTVFKSIDFTTPILDEEGLGWLLFSKVKGENFRVDHISATNARLDSHNLSLTTFDAHADIGQDGKWKKIVLDSAENKLHAVLQHAGEAVQVDLSADSFKVPFGSAFTLEQFIATGIVRCNEIVVTKFSSNIYDGVLTGNAILKWDRAWSLQGELEAKVIDAAKFVPELLQSGKLEGQAKYTLQAQDGSKLFTAPRLEGNFAIHNGVLLGVDLAALLKDKNSGSNFMFTNLTGDFFYDSGKAELFKMLLTAGMVSARGNADMDANKNLSGRFVVDLKSPVMQVRGNLAVSGKLKEPRFNR